MKNIYLLLCSVSMFLFYPVQSQTLWTGPAISFSKADSVDWTLEENQDRITDLVWITRANSEGFFNIAQENGFNRNERNSPIDTEWAAGSISDGIENLNFEPWFQTLDGSPQEKVNEKQVLHLITDDIYIDIVIKKWTGGGGGSGTGMGGGFRYERSTDPVLSVGELKKSELSFYPNPTKAYISFVGTKGTEQYEILDLGGRIIQKGRLDAFGQLDVRSLAKGIYIIRLEKALFDRLVKF